MIKKISTSVGLCLLLSAALPGVGCGTSDPAPTGDSAGARSTAAGAAGATSLPTAGASTTPGGASNASAGSPSSAGGNGSGVGGALMSTGGAGGALASGGAGAPSAGAGTSGGASGGAHSGAGAGGSASGGAPTGSGCDTPGLVWKSANKTNYTSYPEPGSDECVKYSGCLYEGLFEACEKKQTLDWVKAHNIVAAFPLKGLELHDLCLKSGNKTIVVTVYDTCGDSDCDGCCTQNKGNKDELIDIESFTDQRWGVDDGAIQWADLGPTKGPGCAK